MKVRMILPSLHVQRELHQIDLAVAGVEFEENEIVSCREQQELCVFVWDGAGDGLLAFVCLRARCCCQCDSEQEGKDVFGFHRSVVVVEVDVFCWCLVGAE